MGTRTIIRAFEGQLLGPYVNTITDEGQAGVRRAYPPETLARLAELKRRVDPDNVLHLNQNIAPASGATHHDINVAPSLPAAVIPFVDGDRQQT